MPMHLGLSCFIKPDLLRAENGQVNLTSYNQCTRVGNI
uniref:Uncharacterized protein n=1 Tax=Anguilla anguilla TaxID=7936 RepID=A0A0E9RR55_ANGAN